MFVINPYTIKKQSTYFETDKSFKTCEFPPEKNLLDWNVNPFNQSILHKRLNKMVIVPPVITLYKK